MDQKTSPHQKGVSMATEEQKQRYTRALDELIQAQEYMDEVQEEYNEEAEVGFVTERMATKIRKARARLRVAGKEERQAKALSEAVQSEDDEAIRRMKQEVIEEIARMRLVPRLEEPQADSGAVGEEVALPPGFPTSEDGRTRAKEIWRIVKQIKEEWIRDFENGYKDDPTPQDRDLVDEVNERYEGKKYRNAKRIKDFVKWGDAGLLN